MGFSWRAFEGSSSSPGAQKPEGRLSACPLQSPFRKTLQVYSGFDIPSCILSKKAAVYVGGSKPSSLHFSVSEPGGYGPMSHH